MTEPQCVSLDDDNDDAGSNLIVCFLAALAFAVQAKRRKR